MSKFNGEFPYDNYWVYAPIYHNKEKRNYAVIVNKNNWKDRSTVSYARYLMSVKEKRILEKWETVDHINNIRDDDRVENLTILTNAENKKKYINYALYHTEVKLICPNCRNIFVRKIKQTHISKGGLFTSCSRHCSGVLRRKLQLGQVVDFSDNVIDIYKIKTIVK
jgi:hypothetical protein